RSFPAHRERLHSWRQPRESKNSERIHGMERCPGRPEDSARRRPNQRRAAPLRPPATAGRCDENFEEASHAMRCCHRADPAVEETISFYGSDELKTWLSDQ